MNWTHEEMLKTCNEEVLQQVGTSHCGLILDNFKNTLQLLYNIKSTAYSNYSNFITTKFFTNQTECFRTSSFLNQYTH